MLFRISTSMERLNDWMFNIIAYQRTHIHKMRTINTINDMAFTELSHESLIELDTQLEWTKKQCTLKWGTILLFIIYKPRSINFPLHFIVDSKLFSSIWVQCYIVRV